MATYTILNTLVQGVLQSVTVAPTPPSLASQTAGSMPSQYFSHGDVVQDTNLGDASVITRLLGLGAIQ